MSEHIERLQPKRWKVFQCLLIEGENAGEEAIRDARSLTISDEQCPGEKTIGPSCGNHLPRAVEFWLLGETKVNLLECWLRAHAYLT